MKSHTLSRTILNLFIIGLLTLAIAACTTPTGETPTSTAAPTTPSVSVTPEPSDTPAVSPTPSDTPAPSATPSPTPAPPAGWEAKTSVELGLSFYHPEGWFLEVVDPYKLHLREEAGEGWLEVNILSAENVEEWGIDYQAGMSSQDVAARLGDALSEDGEFTQPEPFEIREERTAYVLEGTYNVFEERLMIGAVGLSGRAIILVGHDAETSEPSDAEWERLTGIYEGILQSITPVEG